MITVLVVDDNEINRHLAAHVLLHRGFGVVTASSGYDALRLVEELRPPIVVLDIQMPGMSGFEVIAALRGSADPVIARTKIVAATALASEEDRRRCLEAGADVYLARPFSIKALVDEVRTLSDALGTPGTQAAPGTAARREGSGTGE